MKKQQDYDEFVEKFKPKHTTDDCFTPPGLYDRDRKCPNNPIGNKS